MILKGENRQNPVLLFLSGGPGIPEYLLETTHPTELYKHFTVCYFSYLGTGLSYAPDLSDAELTTEAYLDHVHVLTGYLQERFAQEKIYLLGHSFGTYMGLLAAEAYPDDYHCYIGMSQICDQPRSERFGVEIMTDLYRSAGNRRMADKLAGLDLSDEQGLQAYLQSPMRDKAMHELGVGTTRAMRSVMKGIFFPSLRMRDFTRGERINLWKGKMEYASMPVIKDAFSFNAFQQVPELPIPSYFLAGEHDLTCNYELQQVYCMSLKAPEKEFHSFSESAHSPLFEEKEKALAILIQIKNKFRP